MTGVVLAGGRSERMGTDKALLVIDGQRLIDRAVATLAGCCELVVVASGSRMIGGLSVAQITDDVADAGPLGGILAAMACAPTQLLAVVAVDMPQASCGVLKTLAQRWGGEAAVVPIVQGRAQPLHAVWSAAAAAHLRALVEAGERRVVAAADILGAKLVELDGDFAHNLNRPEDLNGGHEDG